MWDLCFITVEGALHPQQKWEYKSLKGQYSQVMKPVKEFLDAKEKQCQKNEHFIRRHSPKVHITDSFGP